MDQEFEEFFLLCQKVTNSNQSEVAKILKPLRIHLWKQLLWKSIKVLLIVTTICCAIYYVDTLNWYFCAIGRIVMIKILPLWNWTYLASAKCLISNPEMSQPKSQARSASFNEKDCRSCEHFGEIFFRFRIESPSIFSSLRPN